MNMTGRMAFFSCIVLLSSMVATIIVFVGIDYVHVQMGGSPFVKKSTDESRSLKYELWLRLFRTKVNTWPAPEIVDTDSHLHKTQIWDHCGADTFALWSNHLASTMERSRRF
jgi:hypothetical protein